VKYLLDTNACISSLNNPASLVRAKLMTLKPTDIVLCSIVEAELYFGVMKSSKPVQNLGKLNYFLEQLSSLPFDSVAAQIFGSISATLAKAGTPIGPYDLQIASIAVVNNLTLVSHNVREFSRVANLLLEDWE
jgi:tRNA(fMet)-specific endonuclease VapC